MRTVGPGFAVALLLVAGCGDDSAPPPADASSMDGAMPGDGAPLDTAVPPDATDPGDARVDGGMDASIADAGNLDASGLDASTPDASSPDGSVPDGGAFDAGAFDAGTIDAGAPDAGASDAGIGPCAFPTQQVTVDPNGSTDPQIVWDGVGYGLIWADTRDGNSEIYFARLDATGAKIGSEVRVTDAAGNSEGAAIVWTGTEYGVFWYDDRTGSYQIYATRLDATGTEIGDDVQITMDPARSWSPSPVVDATGFAVSWWDNRDGNDELYFARLDATLAKIGSDVRVTTGGDAAGSSLVWNGTEYAVAWRDSRTGRSEMFFTRLDASGVEIGDDIQITTTTTGSSSLPSLVYNGSGYALGWEDSRRGAQELFFVLLDATGGRLGSDMPITDRLFTPWNLVWTGTVYAAAWSDDRDGNLEIYFAVLDATGARIGTDRRITNDPALSRASWLAWNGSTFGLVWDDLASGNWDVYFTELCE